jgi:hypothetical protein
MTDCLFLQRAFLVCVLLSSGLCGPSDSTAQVRKIKTAEAARRQAEDSKLQIKFVGQGKNAKMQRFVVTGLPETVLRRLAAAAKENPNAWVDTMVVTVVSDAAGKPRPMLGDYSVDATALAFVPRFPLRNGTTYRVEVFAEANRTKPSSREFELAARGTHAPTRLLTVYPTTNVLPENQLKFYLQFSSAMSRGEAYRRVKLLDQDGKQVEFPFLELGEELWDPSGTRFTLFFDPGRIKRGLKPRELFGPALVEGRSYTLVVDQAWQDADGHPLKAAHRKKFKVVAPDDLQPKPADWQIIEPLAESRRPLVVAFGESLDHAMLQRVLTVTRHGNAVAGRIAISKQESQWSFQPDAAWAAGQYSLSVDAALEDLAGNSIGRPFEVDVFEKVDRQPQQARIRIPFEVHP